MPKRPNRPNPRDMSLLRCRTERASAREELGTRGATLRAGPFTLVVPPSAVAEPATFTLEVPDADVRRVRIQANGADEYEFARPVTLRAETTGCDMGKVKDLYIIRVAHDSEEIIEVFDSDVAAGRGMVSARLERIGSGYAIGT